MPPKLLSFSKSPCEMREVYTIFSLPLREVICVTHTSRILFFINNFPKPLGFFDDLYR